MCGKDALSFCFRIMLTHHLLKKMLIPTGIKDKQAIYIKDMKMSFYIKDMKMSSTHIFVF